MPCTHRQPSFVSAFCRIPSFTSAALYTSSTKRSSINKSSSRSSMFVAWFTTRSMYCLRRRKELACTYRQNLANSYLQRHTKRQQVSATAMTVAAASSNEGAKKFEKDSQVRVFSYSAREFLVRSLEMDEHVCERACSLFHLRLCNVSTESLAEHCLFTLFMGLFFMRRELDTHVCE